MSVVIVTKFNLALVLLRTSTYVLSTKRVARNWAVIKNTSRNEKVSIFVIKVTM